MHSLDRWPARNFGGRGNRRLQNEQPLLRWQRHHPHPEHGFVADVDIVLAHECQLAVTADAEYREASRYRRYRIAFPHIDRQVMLRNQHPPAWVNVKRARVELLRLDLLYRRLLAGGLIDRVYDDAVFTTLENLLALKLGRRLGTICPVHKTAVRMDVARACCLPRPDAV